MNYCYNYLKFLENFVNYYSLELSSLKLPPPFCTRLSMFVKHQLKI